MYLIYVSLPLASCCVQCLDRYMCWWVSETWPVRKENEVALQRSEMRTIRWMCVIKLKDKVPSKELRERLGLGYTISVLQQNRLHWYGHVLQKEGNDWVKKCMEYEVEGTRPRGWPKKTWTEIVQRKLKHLNWTGRMPWIAVDGGRMIDDQDRCEWVNVSFGTGSPRLSWTKCVCVCLYVLMLSLHVSYI